jgi:hypothetical protein
MKRLLLIPVFVMFAQPAFAQDVDAMAKWTALTVVHYRVVGEFTGPADILSLVPKFPVSISAAVTDRVDIEFDWNQQEMKLVGKPVIRNSPSKTGAIAPRQGCPATKVDGAFEFATVLTLKEAPGGLALEIRRDHAGGAVPLPGAESGSALCGHGWDQIAPKATTHTEGLVVPPAMALAVPGVFPISTDKKSLIVRPKGPGWTWTYTPTAGK